MNKNPKIVTNLIRVVSHFAPEEFAIKKNNAIMHYSINQNNHNKIILYENSSYLILYLLFFYLIFLLCNIMY